MFGLTRFVILASCCLGFVECLKCPCFSGSAVLAFLPGLTFAGLLIGGGAPALFGGGGGDHADTRRVGRTLLSSDSLNITWDPQIVIGYILGCISGLLYVSSRLPQIIKNVSPSRGGEKKEYSFFSNWC